LIEEKGENARNAISPFSALEGGGFVEGGYELEGEHVVVAIGSGAGVAQFVSEFQKLKAIGAEGGRGFEDIRPAGDIGAG
jgi:hypothetical protein